ncbi:MAG: hypothetical protein U9R42_14660 [Bacteroidota bacterium]|nr:hypothetical protein [Bacteroidota bacterium]
MLKAECGCGYESEELLLGGGFRNFMTECALPFYCDHCETVFTRNILNEFGIKKFNRCPKCKRKVSYYGEIRDALLDEEDNDYVFDWRINDFNRYFLLEGHHHCPKCKKDKVKFYLTACWD